MLGAVVTRDFTKMWGVRASRNWVPTMEDAGCEGLSPPSQGQENETAEGSAEKRTGEEADKLNGNA